MKTPARFITAGAICALLGSTALAAGNPRTGAPPSGPAPEGRPLLLAKVDCKAEPNAPDCIAGKVVDEVEKLVRKAKNKAEKALSDKGGEEQAKDEKKDEPVDQANETEASDEASPEAGTAAGEESAGDTAKEASGETSEPEAQKLPETQAVEETVDKSLAEDAAGNESDSLKAAEEEAGPKGKARVKAKARGEAKTGTVEETDTEAESTTAGDAEDAASAEGESEAARPAPVLDSAKQAVRKGRKDGEDSAGTGDTVQTGAPAETPDSDAEAQAAIETEIESVTSEKGRTVEAPREERTEMGEIVRELGDRLIYLLDGEMHVERRERDDRVARGARDVRYEELSGGRTREIVERRNGVQVITIRNRAGDILHRAKIYPDGREVVLFHLDRRDYDRLKDRREAGWDLPPMRLTIPVDEYILEARRVRDRRDYYDFLRQPPVERVERTYAVSEVTESPRIRDKARRIDLDTITFDFNSAAIGESQVPKLDDVAWAIRELIEENPGETFLVEGHTDAVGSDLYNLALSDRRAEAVVDALTYYYEIPPENLVPQGYGEQFLKVETEDRNRENRRVAIRRITPLVAPVASAE